MVDPGFPIGGRGPIEEHGPLMWTFFGENERIGFHMGGVHRAQPPRSANDYLKRLLELIEPFCIDPENFSTTIGGAEI